MNKMIRIAITVSVLICLSSVNATAQQNFWSTIDKSLEAFGKSLDENYNNPNPPAQNAQQLTPQQQQQNQQQNQEAAFRRKLWMFELQKALYMLEGLVDVTYSLVEAQRGGDYGVVTDAEKIDQLRSNIVNIGSKFRDDSTSIDDYSLVVKARVERIQEKSERMQKILAEDRAQKAETLAILETEKLALKRENKIKQMQDYYSVITNQSGIINQKITIATQEFQVFAQETQQQGAFDLLKMGIGIYGAVNSNNAALQATSIALAFQGAAGAAELAENFERSSKEFEQYADSIEQLAVKLKTDIEASKQWQAKGNNQLVWRLKKLYVDEHEGYYQNQELQVAKGAENLENPFADEPLPEFEEVQVARVEISSNPFDDIWNMPLEEIESKEKNNTVVKSEPVVAEKAVVEQQETVVQESVNNFWQGGSPVVEEAVRGGFSFDVAACNKQADESARGFGGSNITRNLRRQEIYDFCMEDKGH